MEREIKKRKSVPREESTGQPVKGIEGDSKSRGTRGRVCMTCEHPRRVEVEQAILDGIPFARIAKTLTEHHPGEISIKRHAQVCIPDIMAQRREKIQEPDELTADLVTAHLKRALGRSDESSEIAFDEDEHGVLRESAQGRSAAIRAHVETIRAAGEICGVFKAGTKVEILLKAPETQEFLTRLVEAVCPGCAVKLKEEFDKISE